MSGHSARGRLGQLRSAARRKLQVVRRKVVGVSAGSIAEIVDARAAATVRETRELVAGSTGDLRQFIGGGVGEAVGEAHRGIEGTVGEARQGMEDALAANQGQRRQDFASTQALERLLFEQQLASDPLPSLSEAANRGGTH